MKRNIALVLLVLVCFCSCRHKPADIVSDAKKTVEEINGKLKDYNVKHVDDLTSSVPGSITGYYREEEVKKVYEEHFGEKSRTFRDYYFDDGMLVCVLSQVFIYNKPNTYTEEIAKANHDSVWYDDSKTRLEQNTYYFSGNKMIKWTANGKEIFAGDPDFGNKEAEILEEAAVLLKELKEE